MVLFGLVIVFDGLNDLQTHIIQVCFASSKAIIRLLRCDEVILNYIMGEIDRYRTTTKHNYAGTAFTIPGYILINHTSTRLWN